MPVREVVTQDVCYEGEVGGLVYLWDDEGVEVRGLEDGGEIVEGEAGGDGVDADGDFSDGWRGRGLQEGEQVGAGLGFLGGGDGVFEVVGYGVDGEGAGFLEEFGGGGGDFWGEGWLVRGRWWG